MEPVNKSEVDDKKALTCIRAAYTLSPTQEDINKSDEVEVHNFLNALAEVALSVAQRKERGKDNG
jgi:hypothetical protein